MHAIIGVFEMEADKQAEQRVGLHERIIPMVKNLPGFVSGYWSHDRSGPRHYSHIVFENAEAAEQLAAIVRSDVDRQRQAGVSIVSLNVVEVLGDARR
jgi:hypothetical protein